MLVQVDVSAVVGELVDLRGLQVRPALLICLGWGLVREVRVDISGVVLVSDCWDEGDFNFLSSEKFPVDTEVSLTNGLLNPPRRCRF